MDKKQWVLGIDVGTTGVKSLLFDLDGRMWGSAYEEYGLLFTPEGIEQDSALWWECMQRTTHLALKEAGVCAEGVAGMAVSTQGISCFLAEEDGTPLMPSINWMDARASAQARQIEARLGKEMLFARTGKNAACYSLATLMWLKANRPEIYARAKRFLLPLDAINLRLTGKAVMDTSIACGTLAYDIQKHAFMSELLAWAGIEDELFSDVGVMGALIGELLPEAAQGLGLPPGIAVALGAQDQNCAALGAGIGEGVAVISLGTSSALGMLTASVQPDPYRRVTRVCMGQERYLTQTVVSTAGAALKWFRNTITPNMQYDGICQLAASVPPGAGGVKFCPNLSGGREEKAYGCFTGLKLSTTLADMARAVLEGISYALVHELSEHERCVGECREIRVFGGGAQSAVWRQILADMSGKLVSLPATHETACLGAAILAAKGAGWIEDPYHPQGMLRPSQDLRLPQRENVERYKQCSAEYEAMYRSMGIS